MDLSIVIPIKDERENVARLHERLEQALVAFSGACEILLVDDGSRDGSHLEMQTLAGRDPRVKVIRLARNFGQSAALQAGIDFAQGDVIVTMDGDLQNDPADIPMLLATLERGGYDAVFGLRTQRQDGFLLRTLPSRLANWLIRKVTGVPVKDMGCTLRAMRKDVAKSLSLYGEMHRFIPVLVHDTGATYVQVPVQHHPRSAGKTKYSLTRTFRVVVDLITVKFMQSYLTRPMHLMGLPGLFALLLGGAGMIGSLVMGEAATLYLSAMLGFLGVQMLAMGLLAEMMMRTYFESQGRRAYRVRSTQSTCTKRAAGLVPADPSAGTSPVARNR